MAQGSRSPGKVCLCFNWEIGAMREPVRWTREREMETISQTNESASKYVGCVRMQINHNSIN